MNPMRRVGKQFLIISAAALVALSALVAGPHAARAADQPQQVATVEELKSEAFKALRSGHFDKTNELLAQAAQMSKDPQLERMASWTKNFETQRQEFAAERHKQYDKALRKVKHLIAKGKSEFALDWAAGAYLLADDKKAFRAEPWVDQLVKQTAAKADEYDKAEQWLRALRLYSDLGSIEPASPLWKEKLK